jgi:hypothetical protein
MSRDLKMNLKIASVSASRPDDRDLIDIVYTDTPENVEIHNTTVGTSSMNVSVAGFPTGASIDYVVVYNTDETNYVTFTFTNVAAASSAHRVGPGKVGVFPDVSRSVTPTLQANTAACLCKIIIIGDDAEA